MNFTWHDAESVFINKSRSELKIQDMTVAYVDSCDHEWNDPDQEHEISYPFKEFPDSDDSYKGSYSDMQRHVEREVIASLNRFIKRKGLTHYEN